VRCRPVGEDRVDRRSGGAGGQQADAHTSTPGPPGEGRCLGCGRDHTPRGVPHPWGATSCREAAPFTDAPRAGALLILRCWLALVVETGCLNQAGLSVDEGRWKRATTLWAECVWGRGLQRVGRSSSS
jgi:hypothetical protein